MNLMQQLLCCMLALEQLPGEDSTSMYSEVTLSSVGPQPPGDTCDWGGLHHRALHVGF